MTKEIWDGVRKGLRSTPAVSFGLRNMLKMGVVVREKNLCNFDVGNVVLSDLR